MKTLATLALAAALFVAGGLGLTGQPGPAAPVVGSAFGRPPAGDVDLANHVDQLQRRLAAVPADHVSWASLGLAYVEQARVTADPSYYPKAEGALARSLELDTTENFPAYAGRAALASGRHDFAAARDLARRGLDINPASATLLGALGDAEIQLGNYPAAFDAIQRMVDVAPGTASLTRASYAWELRGEVGEATALMRRALDDAVTAADRAFARYYLGELAFHAGDPTGALAEYEAGLAADPSQARLLEGRAKARAALGQTEAALSDYATVVARLPEPAYLIQYGELLESAGRVDEAQQQYRLFATVARLFEDNGVRPDVDQTLFAADHGDPAAALRYGEAGIATRQFVDMADAYAWALHVNGRDTDALAWSDKALELGTRNALFHFHAGMIRAALGDSGGARARLTQALEINPHFSPIWAPVARQSLGL
ncbi:MAG: tetratricopeptide repeat protein [Acidimicrobiales bacterium]